MKNYLLLLAALCGAVEMHGAAITVEANDDNGFSASSSGDLPVGSLVRVGTFNIPDSTISANSTNPSFLNAQFTEFGTARIGDGGNLAGHLSQTIDNPSSNTQGFANKQVYLWVFNSTDNSSAANSFNTAFEQGVFYLDMTTAAGQNSAAPKWRFRDHNEIPNRSTIDLTDLTTADSGTLAPGARVVIGIFPHGTSSSTGAADFGLVQIPEPTSLALGVAITAGLALRRRRLG